MKQLLFVCTGNFYRSRFAEIYFNHHASQNGLPWRALSVGTKADQGLNEGPISIHTTSALEHLNIPYQIRYPIQIDEKHLISSDHVILLKKEEHFSYISQHFAAHLAKVQCWNIHDIDVDLPAVALQLLQQKVDQLLTDLNSNDLPTGMVS